MTVDELKKLANDKIQFYSSNGSLLLRSLVCRYADFLGLNAIKSIEKKQDDVIIISIPSGSAMGDREISVDLSTGIVTADDKVFDEPLPSATRQPIRSKRKSGSLFTPTINGFSIKSVQMMPSEDGYACSCKVFFNGKKVGDFLDKGDGSEYSFWADPPYSTSKIESVVRNFPSMNRDYGYGTMEVPYDMNQMVNDLMEMKEIAKELRKLEGSGKDYVIIDEWRSGRQFTCTLPIGTSDVDLKKKLDNDLMMHGISVYNMRRYRGLENLHVVNMFVIEELLK